MCPLVGGQLREVFEFPAHGRQVLGARQTEQRPVGLALLHRNQKPLLFLRHLADDLLDEIFARLQEVIEADRLVHHALEAPPVFGRNIEPLRRENFGHRPVMAQQVDDEGLAQRVVDAFICQQVAHVEQVARVLAVERRHDLAGVEIRKVDERHFGEPELLFDLGRDALDCGLIDTAAQYRRDLDLDLRVVGPEYQLGRAVLAFGLARIDLRAANAFRDRVRDPFHPCIDRLQRCCAIRDGHVGQIDIDREPRQVAHEQIDRRAALEREFLLRRDEGHRPDQQGHLLAIIVSDRHRATPEP